MRHKIKIRYVCNKRNLMKTQSAVIERLLKYRDVMQKMKGLGFVRVFSDNLADAVGVSPSLVRKDFSIFGLTGNKRGGYHITSRN